MIAIHSHGVLGADPERLAEDQARRGSELANSTGRLVTGLFSDLSASDKARDRPAPSAAVKRVGDVAPHGREDIWSPQPRAEGGRADRATRCRRETSSRDRRGRLDPRHAHQAGRMSGRRPSSIASRRLRVDSEGRIALSACGRQRSDA